MLSRPQGHIAAGIPVTPSGMEPATFLDVGQCLNQLRHRPPPDNKKKRTFSLQRYMCHFFDVIFER
jgi:hypothetical protein